MMPNPSTHQLTQLTEVLPGGLFREKLAGEMYDESSQVWQCLLRAFGPDGQGEADEANPVPKRIDVLSRELQKPLVMVAPGPWRSIGGYLDYTDWKDRERFMELDRAIAMSCGPESEDEDILPTAA